ncbi:hypothetical protein CERSUDRAFT_118132 [Gelatoporia subvermispora B]|uniref:NmrA-like domain-containing protein n=1 Tax=Ceriporiopsis subvermispora (strain B) TaxID=914234 RepID=M2Q895_CERS8|nr:hypothetical protein CERSUDRAFT_118132 [Gelatoporia subvermispora B]
MVKYVLTGATGGLGSQVLKYLLQLVPASDIAVSLHNPSGLSQEILSTGIEVRQGDFADPASLDRAFAGAEKLLIVSYPSIAHELRVQMHTNAIDAAKRCGVKHLYYTSLAFAGDSVAAVMQAHLDTERYLQASGLTYTILREGIYSESFPLYLGFFDPAGGAHEVRVPHSDGGVAWVSRPDLGEGTARIMASGAHANETLLLSGARARTLAQLAATVSALVGRTLALRVVPEDEYVRAHAGGPGPRGEEAFLRKWATTYRALARGELAVVDPLLQQILGRPLKPVEETVAEMLQASGAVMEQYAK